MDSDDDDFLYGGAPPKTPVLQQPTPIDAASAGTVVARLQDNAEVAVQLEEVGYEDTKPTEESEDRQESPEELDQEDDDEEEESDDDIEIIMAQPARSIDHRPNIPGGPRPPQHTLSTSTSSAPPRGPQPSLTTEYTPISRAPPLAATSTKPAAPPVTVTPATTTVPENPPAAAPSETPTGPQYDGPDPATLPPVTAAASHPTINPLMTATLDGRSILDVDLDAMTESGKAWRRPGSDLSDWFNYGFDELSWEAYCYRRRDLGEMGGVLKANLITFSGMPEDQIGALPAEVRQMVMTGSTALVSGNAMNGNMINAGGMGMPGMNMMDMSMNPMMMNGMNPMGDIGMQQMMMQQQQFQDGTGVVGDGTPEQGQMMQEYPMGMGMEFGMDANAYQQQQQQPIQPVGSENQALTNGANGPPVAPANRAVAARGGRGAAPLRGVRGAGFVRGRGRGGVVSVSAPGRPTSPLPPNVPTGPRNQNKYKDRDTNAPAVDGLDYGAGASKDRDGGRTPSREPEERNSSRKRRSSPGMDDSRSSKRR